MGKPVQRVFASRDVPFSSAAIGSTVVVGALYFGQAVLVPVLLATLLVFVLNPAVRILERRGLGRLLAVVITVSLVCAICACGFWVVMSEAYSLLAKLPEYTGNITAKVRSIKHIGSDSTIQKLDFMFAEISRAWNGDRRPVPLSGTAAAQDATHPLLPNILSHTSWLIGSALEGAVNLALAFVLVFFALLRREAIRNRMLRLAAGRLAAATQALDEVGARIGRYLRVQLLVNASFGLVWGGGLFVIGVDYALLWGVLGGLLRYIPYVGPVLGGLLPITLSFAESPGWTEPISAICVFLALEFTINSIVEPFAYGQSLGVSEVALLVSAAFWAMMWGPVGLILSGPLTVCLAVVGRHVHQFRVLALLLGDEQVLAPHVSLYQRLLARDHDEASQLALSSFKSKGDATFDELLLPCLNLLKSDRQNDFVSEEQELAAIDILGEIIDDLAIAAEPTLEASIESKDFPHRTDDARQTRVRLLAYPARDIEDKLALDMLRRVLNPRYWSVEVVPLDTLTSELVERVADGSETLILIGALPPGGLAHTRYICKRMRARFSNIKISVGRWAPKMEGERDNKELDGLGADLIASSLLETRDQLASWLPVLIEEEKVAAAG